MSDRRHTVMALLFQNRRRVAITAASVGLAVTGTLGTAVPANAQVLGFTAVKVVNFLPATFSVDVNRTRNGATERASVDIVTLQDFVLGSGTAEDTGNGGSITISGTMFAGENKISNGQRIAYTTTESENGLSLVEETGTLTCTLDGSGNGFCT